MKWKVLACGLLVAVCLGLLAVEGVSQSPPPAPGVGPATQPVPPGSDPNRGLPPVSPPIAPGDASLETLVQQLKQVRAQQEQLKADEKALLAKIAQRVDEQRKALQKAEELLQQLQGKPPLPKQDSKEDKSINLPSDPKSRNSP
jgi:hypothetical protein